MIDKWLYMIAMVLVIVGGIVMGSIGVVSSRRLWVRVVCGVVVVAALGLALRRDVYLPFLGETVMPCSILEERVPDHADTEVSLHGITPGAKVLYWASEPATKGLAAIADWRRAYLDFANAGVAVADAGGHVMLRLRKPQPYTVPTGRRIESHVHWRVCGADGLLGPVQKTDITGGPLP